MIKLIKTSTVPESLNILLKGQLKYLSEYFNIVAVSGKNIHLEEVEDREGVAIFPIEMQRKISPLQDLISLMKLYKYLKKEKPTLIHSITPKAGLLSMLAGKMAGVPIRIHTFTGLIFPTRTGFMQKLLIKMDQLLCWAATNIYPEGKGVASDLKKYNITDKPLNVIANGNVNGIDLDHFNPDHIDNSSLTKIKEELGIKQSDFVFIFVGRIVGDKGINELIKAFVALNGENVKLLLVGTFEEELDPLQKDTYDEIQKNQNIITVGFKKDVRPYFLISDALVFPSYREGFPNVVMQAGAMELPSVVSNINGCNEIIIQNENGLIVPSKNVEKLEEAMKLMISNKENYLKMKSNARKMIENRYDQNIVWKALLDEYQKLLTDKKININV
ncbi:glycosyltransferase family 4 protein [Chryseobacterium oncorhynchi]|uniref:Glycosyltransferase family 1 protein n=1 Tax=Chryseobacterium oncorhynchi TaxID=741074 RepID=A0A316WJJ2_9FLAO|nr:glycosyltransferase family 4 protein [Chryseobacterium oncorhynchi]PWN60613.1 glycosyltransferase family 1 protein [Chryseobacterium oncorhynchi]